MKSKSTKPPTLRYPQFVESWKDFPLGDILDFKNGFNAEKSQYGSGVRFISVLDIINTSPIVYDSIIGNVTMSEREFKNYEVKYGDILFQRSSETREEVGQSNVYLDKTSTVTFGGFVIRGTAKRNYDPLFLHYLLKSASVRKDITSRSGGSTRYNIGQESLKDVRVVLPSLPEQQKIAIFLSAVDEKISQLGRKKELILKYKKGVMQRIFDRKIRFKNDNGEDFPDWEEKKLGDVAVFSKGVGISKEDTSFDGLHECIRYGELYTHYSETIDQIVSRTNLCGSELSFSNENDVIIPSSGETNVDIARAACILRKGVALGGDLTIIRSNLNGVFLSYYLNSKKKYEIARLAQGVSVVHLYPNQLATLQLEVPSIKEQRLIADFLSSIDKKVALLSRRIESTKQFKNGLLQQMFV